MERRIEQGISGITGQIIKKYRPQAIILFGSAAHGSWDRDTSDLDFLVVKSAVPERSIDRILELENLIERDIACDFLIYRPEELKERQQLGDPFILSILKEGKVLYGSA
ncbi:MAG: nucleotidyltransferase domain-containing protein [Elusimicrobiota bacterium]